YGSLSRLLFKICLWHGPAKLRCRRKAFVRRPVPDAALRAIGLSKSFGALRAVTNVSLDLNIGELHALIGPNGAGKSTLINLLSGDLHATSGKILIGGRDVTSLGPDRRGLAGIGRSYQKTTIFPKFPALENVRLAAQAHSQWPLSVFGEAKTN